MVARTSTRGKAELAHSIGQAKAGISIRQSMSLERETILRFARDAQKPHNTLFGPRAELYRPSDEMIAQAKRAMLVMLK